MKNLREELTMVIENAGESFVMPIITPHAPQKSICTELDCNNVISERLQRTHTNGCMVLCEDCWMKTNARIYRVTEPVTFKTVLAAIHEAERREAAMPKKCDVCGDDEFVQWVSGAGRYLCEKHQDDY